MLSIVRIFGCTKVLLLLFFFFVFFFCFFFFFLFVCFFFGMVKLAGFFVCLFVCLFFVCLFFCCCFFFGGGEGRVCQKFVGMFWRPSPCRRQKSTYPRWVRHFSRSEDY